MLSSLENRLSISPVPFDFPVDFPHPVSSIHRRPLSFSGSHMEALKLSPTIPKIRPNRLPVNSKPIVVGICPMRDKSSESEVTDTDVSYISVRYDEGCSIEGPNILVTLFHSLSGVCRL
jgi:hypothetical protein